MSFFRNTLFVRLWSLALSDYNLKFKEIFQTLGSSFNRFWFSSAKWSVCWNSTTNHALWSWTKLFGFRTATVYPNALNLIFNCRPSDRLETKLIAEWSSFDFGCWSIIQNFRPIWYIFTTNSHFNLTSKLPKKSYIRYESTINWSKPMLL